MVDIRLRIAAQIPHKLVRILCTVTHIIRVCDISDTVYLYSCKFLIEKSFMSFFFVRHVEFLIVQVKLKGVDRKQRD